MGKRKYRNKEIWEKRKMEIRRFGKKKIWKEGNLGKRKYGKLEKLKSFG